MTSGIVGRDEELASLLAFLAQEPATPSALVLEGEAGIGKSTLWLAGVEAARDRGLQVLTARPAEAERGLAFAGLGDCFEPVLDRILPALATPRRRALEVACSSMRRAAAQIRAPSASRSGMPWSTLPRRRRSWSPWTTSSGWIPRPPPLFPLPSGD